ncbi:MAG: penicillin-binding protein 2 [Rikenellaceae bacterium]|nr:penicillin-binding protein 2 [Rikenellaceae bacterium]
MGHGEGLSPRALVARIIVVAIFVTIVLRLGYLQLVDGRYGEMSDRNYLRNVVIHPPRGEIYDRNGELLAQNRLCYDVSIVRKDMPRGGFDTLRVCEILGLTHDQLVRSFKRSLPRREYRLMRYPITVEQKLLLDEMNISGFYTSQRTVRQYPRKIGGNLLGSIGEVSQKRIAEDPDYSVGDYIGMEGLELAYERELRGEKGLVLQDIFAPQAERNTIIKEPQAGKSIVCTIDAELQQFAEELMRDKVGAVVAIEPSTGEILVMASAPTFNPDNLIIGKERGNNYMRELNDPRRPLWNRAVKSRYPPGSTFKLVTGLIGMQEGVLRPHYMYSCHMGYHLGGEHIGCHEHRSPLDLRYAIATSCNAYFCYVFRNILENKKFERAKDGFDVWRDYVLSFGFGRKLDSDFLGEGPGFVPDREFYDKRYRRSWNALTLLSLSIGQGELGCTPLQMANLAATVANRGYYYIPHIVRGVEGRDSLDSRFYERQYTKVDKKHFDVIVEGMWRGVNVDGTCQGAKLKGLDVCGKTGTAQNSKGEDHSTFISFAPRNNPRIAIAVYVEHGGFGAEMAVPIASLIEEKYLTDTITRPWLVDYVKQKRIAYPMYRAKKQR